MIKPGKRIKLKHRNKLANFAIRNIYVRHLQTNVLIITDFYLQSILNFFFGFLRKL
jgi:hypothetical protein